MLGVCESPLIVHICTVGQLKQGFFYSFLKTNIMVQFQKDSFTITVESRFPFQDYLHLQRGLSETMEFIFNSSDTLDILRDGTDIGFVAKFMMMLTKLPPKQELQIEEFITESMTVE
jgi:hypothetical protein